MYLLRKLSAGCINFTQLTGVISIFIGIIIAGYPECFMITGYSKLRCFFCYDKMFKFCLLRKFIPESDSIVEQLKIHV